MKDDTLDDMSDDEAAGDERLKALRARVAQLPRSIQPPTDAWAGIWSAITAPDSSSARGVTTLRPVALWQRPMFLAAAAALLVVASSAATARFMSDSSSETLPVAVAPPAARSGSGPATLAEFTIVENDYIRMANQLSEVVQSDESRLAPETVAKLNESIRVIDTAILEARRALAADPANSAIVKMLAGSYEQKLDLLRRTTEMARS